MSYRTTTALPFLLVLAAWPGVTTAGAQETPSLAVDVAYEGKYVWRGANLVDDPVVQPSAAVSWMGLTASVWGNLETTDYTGHSGEFTEVDYTLDYSLSRGALGLSLGAIYYEFPHTDADPTTEVYVAVGLAAIASPTLTIYRDLDQVEGTYVSLSVGGTFTDVVALGGEAQASLEVSAAVGHGSAAHNGAYYGESSCGLTDLSLRAALPFCAGGRWTVSPGVRYSTLLDGDLRDAMDEDDNFWLGISVSCSL